MNAPLDPIHVRAGVESLEMLHQLRRELVDEAKSLRAKVGNYRREEAQRKVVLAWCILDVREKAEKRPTDALADAMARTQPRYTNHLNGREEMAERLAVLDNEIESVSDRIKARDTELYYVRQEMNLTR